MLAIEPLDRARALEVLESRGFDSEVTADQSARRSTMAWARADDRRSTIPNRGPSSIDEPGVRIRSPMVPVTVPETHPGNGRASGGTVRFERPVRWIDARFVARPKRRRRAEIDARPFHDGAADALRLAMVWAAEIDTGVATRASIARREGLSRARVTQLMRLLGLEGRVRSEILDGSRVCSVRGLLRLA